MHLVRHLYMLQELYYRIGQAVEELTEENRNEIPGKIVEIMRDMGISPQE